MMGWEEHLLKGPMSFFPLSSILMYGTIWCCEQFLQSLRIQACSTSILTAIWYVNHLLIAQVSNRRSRRMINDRLLMELVPRLNAEEIRGLFAPPPWGNKWNKNYAWYGLWAQNCAWLITHGYLIIVGVLTVIVTYVDTCSIFCCNSTWMKPYFCGRVVMSRASSMCYWFFLLSLCLLNKSEL